MHAKRTYLVYYAVAVLIWGSETALTKAFLLDSLAPEAMLVLRTAITALVLLPLVWLRFCLALPVLVLFFGAQAAAALPTLKGQDVLWLLWMGGISSGLTFVFYYKGLQASNAILASVMTLLGPVTGLALSVFLLHESFNAVQVIGIAGLLSTVYFLSTADIRPTPRKTTRRRRAWQDGAVDPGGPTPSSEQPHHG